MSIASFALSAQYDAPSSLAHACHPRTSELALPPRLFGHNMSVFVTCPLVLRIEVRAGSEEENGPADRASNFGMSFT
jgi:hypothetical protein